MSRPAPPAPPAPLAPLAPLAALLFASVLLSCSSAKKAPTEASPDVTDPITYPSSGDTLAIVDEPGVGSAVYRGTGLDPGDPPGFALTGLGADLDGQRSVEATFDGTGLTALALGTLAADVENHPDGSIDYEVRDGDVVVFSGQGVAAGSPRDVLARGDEVTPLDILLCAADDAAERARFLCGRGEPAPALAEILTQNATWLDLAQFLCLIDRVLVPRLRAAAEACTDELCDDRLQSLRATLQVSGVAVGLMLTDIATALRDAADVDPCPAIDPAHEVIASIILFVPGRAGVSAGAGVTIEFDAETIVHDITSCWGEIDCPRFWGDQSRPGSVPDQLFVTLRNSLGLGDHSLVVDKQNNRRALLSFTSALVADEDTGAPVFFRSVRGTLSLEEYGSDPGDRIKGTFTASLEGLQRVLNGDVLEFVTRTGTMSGRFDIVYDPPLR